MSIKKGKKGVAALFAVYTWYQILLFFFLYCIFGWIFESLYVSFSEHKWTNRGFLRGPWIPIYGFGAMIIVFATEEFRGNYLAEFLSGMLTATVFEYLVGQLMEAIFKIRYWDYSHKRFQYKGYISLESSLCWGVLAVCAAELIQPLMQLLIFPFSTWGATLVAELLAIAFAIDTIVSIRDAWGVRNLVIALEKMKQDIEVLKENMEELRDDMMEQIEEHVDLRRQEMEQLRAKATAQLAYKNSELQKKMDSLNLLAQRRWHVLHRNPNAKAKKFGNLHQYIKAYQNMK